MKRILVIYYSQSGQLSEILESFLAPLIQSEEFEITWERLQPQNAYPFPWPPHRFFDVLPESVLMEPPALKPVAFDPDDQFDLIVLAYTVWFLAPSLPISGFLQSVEARVFNDKAVITVVNCRDKWLMAQERVKEFISHHGGRLTDNVAFVQRGNPVLVLLTTLRWLWFGKKAGFWNFIPDAGICNDDIQNAVRFGKALRAAFDSNALDGSRPVLAGLGAVKVDAGMLQQEKAGYRQFTVWAKWIKRVGKQGQGRRLPILGLFIIYLACLIVMSLPLALIFRVLINPFRKQRLEKEIAHFEQPSGSATSRMEQFAEY